MFSRIRSAVCSGIEGKSVAVETDVARGLPGIYIVGLASTMIMESRERIRSAIVNTGLEYPKGRITVNLTPASIHKTGSGLDLPIAVGILVSNGYVDPHQAGEYGIIGELALDGKVLAVSGVLPMLISMKAAGMQQIIIPEGNRLEASLISGLTIYTVADLAECIRIVNGIEMPEPLGTVDSGSLAGRRLMQGSTSVITGDFADIRGQENAKRAIVIAVTGRHGLIMIGSPGCGKTMLSQRIPTIMPPMNEKELIETAMIYSASGIDDPESYISSIRPFRHPNHSIGRAGLIGGGNIPVPGEISLAHNGVLFLDEICEFERDNIEALRIPVEEHRITHFRKGESYTFPCNFQLIMASNPCPCGYFGDRERVCKCTEAQLERYRKKLSGPIMDRIDMKVTMERVTYDELRDRRRGLSSEEMRRMAADGVAFGRSMGRDMYNADMNERDIGIWCKLGREEERFMNRAYDTLKMSPRSYTRTLKVARTIADLDRSESIRQQHLAEALGYRIIELMPD